MGAFPDKTFRIYGAYFSEAQLQTVIREFKIKQCLEHPLSEAEKLFLYLMNESNGVLVEKDGQMYLNLDERITYGD